MYCRSGTFDGDFIGEFFNCQTKVTTYAIFKRALQSYVWQSLANPTS